MRKLHIGLIGSGFMGKSHALAYGAVHSVFTDVPKVELEMLCDLPLDKANDAASQFGFNRATDDWQELVNDPKIDVVAIATPNRFHKEMALAAIAANKHVHCEKPLGLTLGDGVDMATAAKGKSVKTIVGYNYLKNPAILHAQKLVADGAIGDVIHFRGWVDEDYQADGSLPWTWRSKLSEAGLGALGDMGCHLVSLAYGLVGPINSLIADTQIVHEERPLPDSSAMGRVENEDTATALIRFSNGAHGSISTSRVAWGRKNRLGWEIHGTQGMLCFEQERFNELQLYQNAGPKSGQGFRTILTGPEHDPYQAFCPAPGHQLGFNDLKVIEVREFLMAIQNDRPAYPDFEAALEFEKVIHGISSAARDQKRVFIE